MKKLFSFAVLLLALALPASAVAVDYNLACVEGTQIKACTDGAKLKPAKVIALAAIPTLDAAHLPIVTEAKGGFGADISGLAVGFLRRAGVNSWTSSAIVVADIAAALNAGGNPITGTVLTASSRIDAPTLGTDAANQHAPPSGTGALVSIDAVQTLTNKSIDAGQLTGSILDARLSANVDLLNAAQTFTARKTFPAAGVNAPIIPAILGGGTGTNGHTVPNVVDDTFGLLAATQSFSNKTYVAAILSGSVTGTYTLAGTPTLGASVTTTDITYNLGDATHRLAQAWVVRIGGGGSNTSGHLVPNVADDTFTLNSAAQTLTNKTLNGDNNTFSNLPGPDFGDGSDGPSTCSSTVNLAKTMNYTVFVAASGCTLNTGGYGIYASTSATVQSGGIIQNNGGNASGATAGTASAGNRYFAGVAGGNGTTTTGQNGSSNASLGFGGAGGNGGAGTGGSGGTGGTQTQNADPGGYATLWNREYLLVQSNTLSNMRAGAGGAGGGGNITQAGGGGGGGGGEIMIKAPTITVDSGGIIRANGGAGANGTASNTGGGGGGGGGVLSLLYRSYSNSGTVEAAGGAKGLSGGGSGVDGVDGSAGRVLTRTIP